MRKLFLFFILLTVAFNASAENRFPAGAQTVSIPTVSGVRADLLKNIAPLVQKSIAMGHYPGAVILAAHRGKIIYQGVFGSRRIVPDIAPMTFDTIFDIASLTKVIVTAPAVMQLVEQGKINLDDAVAKYWPAFGEHGKESVTIRELLTHTSGLPPDLYGTEAEIFRKIEKLSLVNSPGTYFLYSDINFVTLQHLVELVSGENFNNYVQNHILMPLAMSNTAFLPSPNLKDKIAPTELTSKGLRWGEVQDPVAHDMGGVSGNAGLFSTASDLGKYAQCFLNFGKIGKNGAYLLGPLTILKMITPQTPTEMKEIRGLGFDIDSVYSNRGILFPAKSFGHTGWTGTSIWIDPVTQTYLIILTSRTHPQAFPVNHVIEDRRAIANILAASITDVTITSETNTESGEISRAYIGKSSGHLQVAQSKQKIYL